VLQAADCLLLNLTHALACEVKLLTNRNKDGQRHHLSLTLDDVHGITEFGLALGCQIEEADKVNTDKLIVECIIGGALFGALIALVAANCANK
jgi:hypothetical protein